MILAPFCFFLDTWILATFTSGSKWENTMEKNTSRQENTMPLKDGEAPKLHPENA